MADMARCILHHHERWDGKGYPKGLKGDKIPLQSRIISIADAYDAMTSERSYRSALPEEVAIDDEKYCSIQGKFGEDYLSSVCAQFHRILNKVDDHYEICLDASCIEAAKIILGSKEKIEFKESEKSLGKYTMSGVLDTRSSEFKDTPIKSFKEIRDFSIKIMQDRNLMSVLDYTLWVIF